MLSAQAVHDSSHGGYPTPILWVTTQLRGVRASVVLLEL